MPKQRRRETLVEAVFRRGRLGFEELGAVKHVLLSGRLSPFYRNYLGGRKVQEFERAVADYCGVKYAIAVSNGTSALHAGLLACEVGEGDEVITTPLTFSATSSSILMVGAKPVYVDVDPLRYNIDPQPIEEVITAKTKAIMPVSLLGCPVDFDPLMEIAEKHGLRVINDNAQALGSEYRGKPTAQFGDVSTLSFQETKVISTLGEGGCVLTNDEEIAEKVRALRNHGQQYGEGVDYVCYNWRMTEAQAAVGVEQMKKLDLFLKTQIENAEYFFTLLPEGITQPYSPPNCRCTYYIMGMLYDEEKVGVPREVMVKKLTEKGLNKLRPGQTIGLGYTYLLYHLPLFRPFARRCPEAESLIEKFFWIDLNRYPSTKVTMEKLAHAIKECMRGF